MARKKDIDAVPATAARSGTTGAPVNVVVVVEAAGRRRARREGKAEGHPIAKGLAGLALAKRLTRRKRPLRARMRKAARRGRKRVRKAARRVRKALR